MSDSVASTSGMSASVPVRWRLSRAESLDLVEQITSIASEGSPLAATLRLSAKEASNPRLAAAYEEIAAQSERGLSLDAALDAAGVKVAPHIQAILSSGIDFGLMRSVAGEFLLHERRCDDLRRRTLPVLLYPLMLLTALLVWWLFMIEYVVAGVEQVFLDFDSELPPLTQRLLAAVHATPMAAVGIIGFSLAAIAAIYLVGGRALMSGLGYEIPLLGPLWRYAHLAEFSNMVATLLERAIPLPRALEITAQSMRGAAIGEGTRLLSAKIAAGQSLARSLETTWPFPPTMSALANWGERQSALASAFRIVGTYYEQRHAYQSHMLVAAFPPLVFVIAAALVQFVVVGLFLPLVKLISDLS